MSPFAALIIGLFLTGTPADAEDVPIMTARGLSSEQPFTIAYPEFLQEGNGPAGTAVFLNHPELTLQVELKIAPAARGASVERTARRFSAAALTRAERRTHPDFTLQQRAVLQLPAGRAFVYTASLTSRAEGEQRLRLVHAELYNGGRRYEFRAMVAADIYENSRELVGFILANFSPSTDGRCCVGPVPLP